MSIKCELIERPTQPALTIRTRTAVQNLHQVMGQSLGAIAQYLGQMGQQPAGAPFAAYYNMDMQNMDVEIGFPIASKVADRGEIHMGEIPGGKAVSCVFVGPYDKVTAAYDALNQWMQANKAEPTGVAYEVYLNDPSQVPPEAIQTQILFPLKSR